ATRHPRVKQRHTTMCHIVSRSNRCAPMGAIIAPIKNHIKIKHILHFKEKRKFSIGTKGVKIARNTKESHLATAGPDPRRFRAAAR
ncbi:MAG TPA: hypothetical protein VNI58_01490, partial [Mariprofundaceae bacterium]|nr:hypothetical protein [Mariprofundaceae bacterium]